MLKFIAGVAGSGKSENIAKQITDLTSKKKQVLLFVPEQYTFEMEKKYYNLLQKSYKYLKVTSFTRFAYHTFKEYGGICGDYADESIKLMLISLAVDEVKDGFLSYEKTSKNINFAKEMLAIIEELKHDNCTNKDFFKHASHITSEKQLLKDKLNDISLIYNAYEALLQKKYKDSLDDLTKAGQKVTEHKSLSNTYIFIDEFKAFTGTELEFIKIMLQNADEVCVSLCMSEEKDELFAHTLQTFYTLEKLAKSVGVRVFAPEYTNEIFRFKNDELKHLCKNVFRNSIKKFKGENKNVFAVLAKNEYVESEFVASTISKLVRENNYNYKDIVVVSRDIESYKSSLEVAFKAYNIPIYLDERRLINDNPLMKFINCALKTVVSEINTDNIMGLLKCNIMGVSQTDIAKLENYSYMWSFRKKDWENDFTLPINENVEKESQKDKDELNRLNKIRKTVVNALQNLSKGLKSNDVNTQVNAVAKFLEQTNVRENLEKKIIALNNGNATEKLQSEEYVFVWNTIENILNLILQVIENQTLKKEKFIDIFTLVSSNFDMGVIPQSLDCVMVSDAQRVRANEPKVLFIMGVNDKVFPFIPNNSGVFTQNERKELIKEFGILKHSELKDKVKEEKFIAYKTLTIPTEKLYISSKKLDVKGAEQLKSYLYNQLKKMFGDIIIDTDDLNPDYFCENDRTSFSVLAENYNQDNEFIASLKEYFLLNPLYSQRFVILENTLNKEKHKIQDLEIINEMFSSTPTMSPSKIESYNKCKFKYFCEYGLKIKDRKKIQLDALNIGNIVHQVLEIILRDFNDYISLDDDKLSEKIKDIVLEIFEDKLKLLGGNEFISSRVRFLYKKLMSSTIIIVNRVLQEVRESGFKPCDVECVIGKNSQIKGYTIKTDNVIVTLEGKVDRIDKYIDKDNLKEYIRVIDYKTGKKEFKLSDIYNGQNLQMYIYLKALLNSSKYKNCIGASVLYLNLKDLPIKESYQEGSLLDTLCNETYKFVGTILDDESVIKATEPFLIGKYADLELKKDLLMSKLNHIDKSVLNEKKTATKNIVSLLELEYIFDVVNKKIKEMVNNLYSGDIEAKPFETSTSIPCDYCYLQNRCGFEIGDKTNRYENISREEFFKELNEEQKVGDE